MSRLSESEHEAIKEAILCKDSNAEIYLYGSRADDSLLGGDIDLLVVSETLEFKNKIDLLIEIKDQIGEQKIDLSIRKRSEVKADAFFSSVTKEGIRLDTD